MTRPLRRRTAWGAGAAPLKRKPTPRRSGRDGKERRAPQRRGGKERRAPPAPLWQGEPRGGRGRGAEPEEGRLRLFESASPSCAENASGEAAGFRLPASLRRFLRRGRAWTRERPSSRSTGRQNRSRGFARGAGGGPGRGIRKGGAGRRAGPPSDGRGHGPGAIVLFCTAANKIPPTRPGAFYIWTKPCGSRHARRAAHARFAGRERFLSAARRRLPFLPAGGFPGFSSSGCILPAVSPLSPFASLHRIFVRDRSARARGAGCTSSPYAVIVCATPLKRPPCGLFIPAVGAPHFHSVTSLFSSSAPAFPGTTRPGCGFRGAKKQDRHEDGPASLFSLRAKPAAPRLRPCAPPRRWSGRWCGRWGPNSSGGAPR